MIYVYFIIKEAVCEYRLFFYLYYRLQRNFRVLRVIRGFFLGSLKARNLLGKSCLRCCLRQEIICNSGRQQTKSLTKISTENALEYLASGKGFILDRLRLEFLEHREQRINPKIYSLPSRDKNNLW